MGGTNLGKSLLAGQVLKQVANLLGLQGYLEVTVESNDFLDFSDYDHRFHSGVLLDGVGDTFTLFRYREILQGRPKKSKGGQSGTQMYAYPFTLSRRAVVATFDLSASNLNALQADHWLSNRRNVITLYLHEKAYLEPVLFATSVAEPSQPADMSFSFSSGAQEPLRMSPITQSPLVTQPLAKRRLSPTPLAPVLPPLPGMPR